MSLDWFSLQKVWRSFISHNELKLRNIFRRLLHSSGYVFVRIISLGHLRSRNHLSVNCIYTQQTSSNVHCIPTRPHHWENLALWKWEPQLRLSGVYPVEFCCMANGQPHVFLTSVACRIWRTQHATLPLDLSGD